MQSKPIGIAVIGTGRAGLIHARNVSRAVRGARLTALADPAPASLQHAAEECSVDAAFSDYRQAIEQAGVDAVVIAAPTSLHGEIAAHAAAGGKHIFCEKPMALNVMECDAMIAAAERAGVCLQIGFMRRFSESFLAAKARLEAGEIGGIVQVKSLTHGPSYPKPWMFDLAKSNGPLAEVNSHDIDSVRWFSGSEFAEVYALGGNYRTPEARVSFPDFYDQVLLTGRLAGGTQASISGAQGAHYAYDARCEILGTHGLLTIGALPGQAVLVCSKDKELRQPSVVSWSQLFQDAYLAEITDFVACIREERGPRAGGRDGRAAVAVVDAGNRSLREHRIIQVEPGP